MQFSLAHPDDPTQRAVLGDDPERGGVFVEIVWNNVPIILGADDVDPDRDPVVAVVSLLTDFGFLPAGALGELRAYLDTPTCWRKRRAPRRVRRVLRIVEALAACPS